jgi:hypothetical protein
LITARLEHPGIVTVHEAGRWPDGTPFYAMKLVAGRPLRELIAERTTVEQRIGLLHHVIAVAEQHKMLVAKVRGHYAYFGITGNSRALVRFGYEVRRAWRK